MIRTRRRVFLPVPRLDIGGIVTALAPWGTHRAAGRVLDTPRGKYSGYSGTHGCLKEYDSMTKSEHEACARFFGGHSEE